MQYSTINTHITNIKPGDTVLHDGVLRTITKSNITRGGFIGTSIFGDSYHSGYKPVKLAIIKGK